MKANHSPAIVIFPSKMSCLYFVSLIVSLTLSLTMPVIFGATAYAQIDRAELEGTVTDSSGAAIAGANVKNCSSSNRPGIRTADDFQWLLPLLWLGGRTLPRHGCG
jgi:hypothetical protein